MRVRVPRVACLRFGYSFFLCRALKVRGGARMVARQCYAVILHAWTLLVMLPGGCKVVPGAWVCFVRCLGASAFGHEGSWAVLSVGPTPVLHTHI